MAQEAFASLQREVRWCPDDEHYPGEFVVLDAYGERRVDWDEERAGGAPAATGWSPLGVFHDALVGESAVPEELQRRLQREGFIEITGGPFYPTHYAAARQIDRIADGSVILAAPGHELVQG